MNKNLVALAVAGAFALPLAAQAQTANVTLYGRLNVDLEFVNGTTCAAASSPTGTTCAPGTTSNPTVARVSSNSSRLGVRGTESLGGGLNAIFQIESSINGDTNGGNLGGRETFVGLQGSWGKATVGRFLMPQDDLHAIFGNAPTLLTSVLSTADLWAQGTLTGGQGGFDAREGNSLRYDSPNINGLTGAVQVAFRDNSGNPDGADANASGNGNYTGAGDNGNHPQEMRHAYKVGGNLIYANGPINLGASFEANQKLRDPGSNDRDFTLTGAYDFGPVRIGAVYENTKYELNTITGVSQGDLKRDFWGVSGTIPVGGGKVYLFWGHAGNGTGSALDGATVGGLVKGADTKSDQYEATYSYSLSPRTLLYTGYVKLNNAANAKYTFNINAYPIAQGGKPGALVFGIVHFF